jgi:hypothetical protein
MKENYGGGIKKEHMHRDLALNVGATAFPILY